ncbi:MAG: hypothetical protein JOZ87_30865 [Chloroflexi bacterium]|nr:hypothetical protein [Chloroflexota bacterium]
MGLVDLNRHRAHAGVFLQFLADVDFASTAKFVFAPYSFLQRRLTSMGSGARPLNSQTDPK